MEDKYDNIFFKRPTRILTALYNSTKPLSLTVISRLTKTTPSHSAKCGYKLEQMDIITIDRGISIRTRRRSNAVSLTQKGKELAEIINQFNNKLKEEQKKDNGGCKDGKE